MLVDGSDREFRQLIRGLFGVAGQFQTLCEKLGALQGLRGAQYRIVMALLQHDAEGGVTVGRLAEYLQVRPNFVTTEAKELERRRLLQRRENPADRRSVLLRLSREGRAVLDQLLPVIRPLNDEIFRGFSRDDFTCMRRLLDELLHTLPDAHAIIDRAAREATRNGRRA